MAAALALIALAGCGSSTAQGSSSSSTAHSSTAASGTTTLRYLDPAFSQITTTSNLAYGRAPGRHGKPVSLTLDLYQPSGDTVARRPAIVWVHGGSFCCGAKTSGASEELAQRFAYLGYVTVSIGYRLLTPTACVVTDNALTPACQADAIADEHDAQAAVRWLRANAARYRIDPDRIGIGGDSAGAVIATLVGLDPGHPGDSGNPGYSSAVTAFMSLSGGVPNGSLGSAAVSAGAAAGLLFSGTADPTVPYQWSVQTASDLLHDGVPAILEPFQGAGHDPYTEFQSQIDTESDYFFYTFMNVDRAQGSPTDAPTVFGKMMSSIVARDPAYGTAVAAERARASSTQG